MSFLYDNFQILDYFISIIFAFIVFISIWKGFIQSILSLLTWIGSIIITLNFFPSLANFISHQLNKINFFNDWDQLTQLLGIVFSIPIIFIISLIILRKIRKMISADIDKVTLGIILDKLFGTIYGFLFSYIVFSTLLFFLGSINNNYILINEMFYFLIDNSIILNKINELNNSFIIPYIPFLNNPSQIN